VFLFKRRAFPPKRPRDDIRFAIAIDVTDGGALGVKVTVELLALPGDLRGGVQAGGREEGKNERFHGWAKTNGNRKQRKQTSFMRHRP
jgi:hypothetical protein